MIIFGFLGIFAPVLIGGLVLGWTACRWWGKGRATIDQVVLSQDVIAEWAAIYRGVQDEREDG